MCRVLSTEYRVLSAEWGRSGKVTEWKAQESAQGGEMGAFDLGGVLVVGFLTGRLRFLFFKR